MRVPSLLLLTAEASLGGAARHFLQSPSGGWFSGLLHSVEGTLSEAAHMLAKPFETHTVAAALPPGPKKDFLNALRPCSPCQKPERIGEHNDGGYVMCVEDLDDSLAGVLSFGVNGFDGWGMSVASRFNMPLHEYDCFNRLAPKPCQDCQVHFHAECIGHHANESLPEGFRTLSTHLLQTGLKRVERSLLFKLDVEGAEWKVLAEEPVDNLRLMRQIVLEFHGITPDADFELYLRAVKKLEEAGFAVAHVHANNCCGLEQFGEFSIPPVLEVTYVQARNGGCEKNLPVHLVEDHRNVDYQSDVEMVLPVS